MSRLEQSTPARPRRISLLDYSPALVFVAIAIADSQRWADPDLWGHVRFGQAVLAQGHLVRHDPYSYSAPGHLWLNHEWLTEVLMGALYNAFGAVGLKLMKFVCSAAVAVFLAIGMAETGAPTLTQFGILIAACVTLAPQMQFRPQIFTFAALSAVMALLSQFNYRGYARLWLAIPLLAIWANLHGGFIMGLAALGTFGAAVFIEDLIAGRGTGRGFAVLSITAAAALATLLTPYGIGTWQAVLHALANPHTRVVIIDWQSLPRAFLEQWKETPAGTYYMIIATGLFVALGVTLFLVPRGDDLPMVCVAALMIAATVAAIRNLPLAVIATAIPLARHLSLALEARAGRGAAPPSAERASLMNQAVAAAIALAMLTATGLFSTRMIAGKPYPVGAISFMREHRLSGNILADFGWGEYLIWHLSPQSRVFIDGRYDTVFPPDIINDYLAFHFAQSGARDFLAKYPHEFVLLRPKDSPAYELIESLNGWTAIYRDETCALFARSGSAAARIPGVPVVGKAPKSYFP